MKITGARLFDPANGKAGDAADICMDGAVIGGDGGGPAIDARGCIALPGGIDIHAHCFAVADMGKKIPLGAWGDAASTARNFLVQGITYWVEPGLAPAQGAAFAPFVSECGMDGGWLSLKRGAPGALGVKLFGEAGMAEALSGGFPENPPHLHLPHLAKGDGFLGLQTFAKRAAGRRCHLSHISHYAFEKEGSRLAPRGVEAAALLDEHKNLSADCGPIVFGPALTFTADVELAGRVSNNGGEGVLRLTGSPFAASPYEFRKERYIDALLWLAAMEFILSVKDLARLSLSIDYPSGGSIAGYPAIIAMLMERDRRDAFCAALNAEAVAASALPKIRRELTLAEIAVITRSAPAAACGLTERGRLGNGARADVVLLREQGDAAEMFARPHYVIRGGRVIVENGKWK
ncbi:MAG: amidohydrolase family protein [Nitrospinae bacterium]|nr:amidohydrolase family protein [Nitrospinota bacterium]